MMKFHAKKLCFLSLFLFTSCSYSLKETYLGDAYNSIYFEKNYYHNNVKDLDDAEVIADYNLEKEKNYVFTSLNDPNYDYLLDGNESQDIRDRKFKTVDDPVCMGAIDDCFKYGMISKLFDGQWVCDSETFERVRVQIDQDGFNYKLSKQCRQNPSYCILSFKSSVGRVGDGSAAKYVGSECRSDVTIHLGFYMLKNNKYTKITCSYPVTNQRINSSSDYCFLGFKLGDDIDLSNCKGFSISYTLNSIHTSEGVDKTAEYNNDSVKHALWLYELYLADSTWH